MAKRYDAVIVGGGHNGLVAACYLAEAGISTLVLERYSKIGGAAISEEYVPGYTFSTGSYVLSLMPRKIVEELRLLDAGVQFIERNPRFFAPFPDGSTPLVLERSRPLAGRDSPDLPEGRGGVRPLRRDAGKSVRGHGSLHPAPSAILVRGRRAVPDARRGADLPEVLPGFGRRHRGILLRKRADAGRGGRLGTDRHLPWSARHRHRLRQALPFDGHGYWPSRALDVCERARWARSRRRFPASPKSEASRFGLDRMSSRLS